VMAAQWRAMAGCSLAHVGCQRYSEQHLNW
jgi:hypothetical protein